MSAYPLIGSIFYKSYTAPPVDRYPSCKLLKYVLRAFADHGTTG
jgi:hypothetical protein